MFGINIAKFYEIGREGQNSQNQSVHNLPQKSSNIIDPPLYPNDMNASTGN